MICYLDASAAMKLLIEETESVALAAYMRSFDTELQLVASWLLHTELQCAANRHPDDVALESVATILDAVTLLDVTRGDLLTAGTLPGRLRSNDAVHLAAALRVGADVLLTYDVELATAAGVAGIMAIQPS